MANETANSAIRVAAYFERGDARYRLCNCGFHGFPQAEAHSPNCPYRDVRLLLDSVMPKANEREQDIATSPEGHKG